MTSVTKKPVANKKIWSRIICAPAMRARAKELKKFVDYTKFKIYSDKNCPPFHVFVVDQEGKVTTYMYTKE